MFHRLNSDLAASRQDYAARQDRMVRQDSGRHPASLHPVPVPGGVLLHNADGNALIGRESGEPFADEAEAKAAADWVERMRNFQNS